MSMEQILSVIALLVAILTIVMTVLGGYLGYLTHTLQGRLETYLDQRLIEDRERIAAQVAARLALLDAAFDLIIPDEDREQPGTERSGLYLLRHVVRLASINPEEVRLGLRAIEGAGHAADFLLPYVERVRSATDWPDDCDQMFEALIRRARDRRVEA